jgi:methylated-DNA-[protein]-cysteine S-methyltransferase
VEFDLGKVVVFEGSAGEIRGVTFDLGDQFESRPSDSPAAMEFALYLDGKRTTLGFNIDLEDESPFRRLVYRRVMEIPYGETVTYGKVAADAGRPGGARAVGQAMAANRYPLIIPCHRVVSGNGNIGGFSSGIDLKRHLLSLEGLEF